MEAIEQPGFDKLRNRKPTAFDQQGVEPSLVQSLHHVVGIKPAIHRLEPNHVNACWTGLVDRLNHQSTDTIFGKYLGVIGQSSTRIDHNTRGVWPLTQSDGQSRRVVECGANPDDDAIDKRAESVQVGEAIGAGDIPGVSRHGGNPTVKRLTDLPDHGGPVLAACHRTIQIEGLLLGARPPVGSLGGRCSHPHLQQVIPHRPRHINVLHRTPPAECPEE